LRAEDRKVLFSLVGFLGGLVLALTLVGIVATHKIAGPAYAMRKKMSEIADGKLPIVRNLRRGDELKAVSLELIRMAESLRNREQADVEKLTAVIEALKSAEKDPNQAISEIESIIQQKEHRLGEDAG